MRADRLIKLLMLLQSRGQMTAQELARELEVTERTVYRDVNALSYSGVPVYTERGKGGGISLIDSYRSDLTGLTRVEVQALFMLSVPQALSELGLDQELRAALLKLAAALPSALRGDERRVRQRIHIDPSPWQAPPASSRATYLQSLQQAVWESRAVDMVYALSMRSDMEPLESHLYPYGLVSKAGDWYLVARRRNHLVVLNLDRVQGIASQGEQFTIPEDFNLARFWEAWCQENQTNRPQYPVVLRVAPQLISRLANIFGESGQVALDQDPARDERGWLTIKVNFEYHDQARRSLLCLGGAIEVLEPLALRCSLKDYAEQILAVYSGGV
jgi:predicted DNA-binding transcriptional regulator YafY